MAEMPSAVLTEKQFLEESDEMPVSEAKKTLRVVPFLIKVVCVCVFFFLKNGKTMLRNEQRHSPPPPP